ncbi:MAG: hypothetical protein DMF77_19555 [Acidobacteria bacterium]|nr:MAG: hypothetical protein DMF77_19555 [Acidobacteriota bacterium]
MRKAAVLTLAVVLAARLGAGQTEVRRVGDTLDVRASAAPVSEVLDRIARETGMKVTYDGAPPRARVSVTLSGVTPAQAVLRVLEGQGLNYALRMDPRSVRVETLLMVAGSGGGMGTVAPAPPTRPIPGTRQIDREPEVAEPDDETPAEAPAPNPEDRKPFPFPGGPSGPAMPLMLPTPPPPTTAASPSPAAPQNPQD